MDRLDDLMAFLRVADAGGFSAAERSTGVPKSRLSRRIAALEKELGVRLVQRSSHAFHLTDVGERVHRHARAIADEANAVRATVSEAQAEPSGLIRVSSSLLQGELFLAGWLAGFMNRYPKVTVSLDLSNHYVDMLAERIDLAIRVSAAPLAAADLVARPIGTGRMVLVGHRALVERHGAPHSIAELGGYPLIAQVQGETVRPWVFRGPDGHELNYQPQARFVSNNLLALREALLGGAGVAQIPREACIDALRTGALVELLPGLEPPASTVYAIYPSRRGLAFAVRTLIDFLQERFRGGA